MTPIQAFVLAPDYDRAFELFELHLQAHGGDADTLMWRGLMLDQLDDEAAAPVRQALDLGREGLVTCDASGLWSLLTPLGAGG